MLIEYNRLAETQQIITEEVTIIEEDWSERSIIDMKLMKVRKRIVYTSVVFALLFAFVFPVSAAEKDSGVPSLSYIEEVLKMEVIFRWRSWRQAQMQWEERQIQKREAKNIIM